ncbi:dUTP diphosphatase [Candidatus Palauibacter sp.]|uniref:dUTP diphosphatase n=1 Tax=Candidatus Palauibacter sp. TaxID=3101350 RepID=UPI003AF2E228
MSDTNGARIVFEKLAPDVRVPTRATEQSAGYDIRAHLTCGPVRIHRGESRETVSVTATSGEDGPPSIVLESGDRALVPTGFRARLPDGYEAQIRMRSSLAWKRGLTVPNAPGTVDADYPDEWFVLVLNAAPHSIRIEHGERIAQAVLHRYEVARWEEGAVTISTDRAGGLGSTGER